MVEGPAYVFFFFFLNPGCSLVLFCGTRSLEGEQNFTADPDWKAVGFISYRLVVVSM